MTIETRIERNKLKVEGMLKEGRRIYKLNDSETSDWIYSFAYYLMHNFEKVEYDTYTLIHLDKPLCEQAENVSNKMHFLFGSDAVEVYESEGIDVLIEEYEDNNLGYELYEWIDGESNPADLLYCFNGLGDYIVISEEDYKKLS